MSNYDSEIEEGQLAKEVERDLKRQQYEKDHWDDVSKTILYLP